MTGVPKPLRWRGRSRADFMTFPPDVQKEMGYALYLAQMGERHSTMAKTLSWFHGGAVTELRQKGCSGNISGCLHRAVR
jgi:phage-related protein